MKSSSEMLGSLSSPDSRSISWMPANAISMREGCRKVEDPFVRFTVLICPAHSQTSWYNLRWISRRCARSNPPRTGARSSSRRRTRVSRRSNLEAASGS